MKKIDLPKAYNPQEVEDRIYKFWEKSGFFNPDRLKNAKKRSYVLLLPPPNITGELHMGHALNATVQDILIRQKRMEGYKTLWLPGTDHAGIATQNVVEKKLKKEGKTRFDLGRERFIKEVWKWKEKYGSTILNQLKKIGASCDWSRTTFTMEKSYTKAVEQAFLYYFKKGLIYKGERPINWCKRCQTSLSDLELEYQEEKGKLWYIRYPLSQKEKKRPSYIIVATTRPETMLGDTAVAVNPRDKRYKDLVGKKVILPLVNREIPIVKDNLVDPNFGTGVVKVTPAHDLKDYEIGIRHNLEMIKVIDKEGKITKQAPSPYQGLDVFEARKKVVEDLRKLKLLQKEEEITHSVPVCYRCGTFIEIIPSKQWFLKMQGLAEKAKKVVQQGKIRFVPRRFEKTYFNWLNNIRDWCISRQIWWGHKIPLKGETDVLDTWFSSALWPFAPFGWPQKTKDLKRFYPCEVLVTARDIINLWVARMVFSGLEFMRKPPFKIVYIHPTVLTKEGKRMSKSLGTGINPIELIEKYGADAVRFGLAWQITGLQDMRFGEEDIVMGRKFCNKIWNASRFVMYQLEREGFGSKFSVKNLKESQVLKLKNLSRADKSILKSFKKISVSVTESLDKLRFHEAARTLYDFFWHNFCDKYIEESKRQIAESKSQKDKETTLKILTYVLFGSLKLLHPFMPFITEEVYQKLPLKNKKKCLMVEDWPARN